MRNLFYILVSVIGISQAAIAQVCDRNISTELQKVTGLNCGKITPAILDRVDKLTLGNCNAAPVRNITLESKDFVGLSNLKELNLCQVIQFKGKVFEPLVNLETLVIPLSLRGFPYESPDIEIFSGLKNLKNLDLEVGWFPQIPLLFRPFQDSLINLRLGVRFPTGVWETADDTGNFVNLKNLKSLIYFDAFQYDPNTYYLGRKDRAFRFLAGLDNLEYLWIDSILKFSPDLFEHTKNLKSLYAKNLKVNISNFDSMANLEILNVEFAEPIQWPDQGKFKNLIHLKVLDISEKRIKAETPFGKNDLPPNFQNYMEYVKFRGSVYFQNRVP